MSATSFGRDQLALRARPGDFLTEDEMRARLPAIFADHAHDSRSDRYAFIPTIDILRGLAHEGFRPVFACQSKARDADMRGFTKHMLRFRQTNGTLRLREEHAEVVAVNSHGGQSQYHLMSGVFRLICTNGMITSDNLGEIKVRHTGRIVDEVIEGTYKIVESYREIERIILRAGIWTLMRRAPTWLVIVATLAAVALFLLSAPAPHHGSHWR